MDKREQQLINDALQKAQIAELPKPATTKTVWIEGIAKIRLSDGSIGYGIVKRNEDLTTRVCYINGNIAAINEIIEVYPYIKLQKEYIKKFGKGEGEKERIEYLQSLKLPWASLDLSEMTIDELNKEVVKAAIYFQMNDMQTMKG